MQYNEYAWMKEKTVWHRTVSNRYSMRKKAPAEISQIPTGTRDMGLPKMHQMLHHKRYERNADPAGEAQQNGTTACFYKLNDIGVESDGTHCHDNEKLGQLLQGMEGLDRHTY